ncbi:unnamed protein product, partial [Sphenostylis stenocarpa]
FDSKFSQALSKFASCVNASESTPLELDEERPRNRYWFVDAYGRYKGQVYGIV